MGGNTDECIDNTGGGCDDYKNHICSFGKPTDGHTIVFRLVCVFSAALLLCLVRLSVKIQAASVL